ncbi:MAG: carboxypeptidase-like regulatory domain-containing protein, partial [Bacteroidales bacterium]|nr:carboxypeptidase-like regulatory domain-containing protein [Bacteroidales bacterium]
MTDAESGETLIAAGVMCGKDGTVTNEFGFYSISLPEGECEISFSYIGYETVTKRVSLSGDLLMNISLAPGMQLEGSKVIGRP